MAKEKEGEMGVLISYFKSGVKNGYSVEELKSNAVKKGYTKTSIKTAISVLNKKPKKNKAVSKKSFSKVKSSKKVKKVKSGKKVKTKPSASPRFSAFSEAIHDLDIELRALSKQKEAMHRSLSETGSEIDSDRTKGKELQERIARLAEQEAHLNEKKKKLQSSLDSVSDKMNKISKIKSEMSDLS